MYNKLIINFLIILVLLSYVTAGYEKTYIRESSRLTKEIDYQQVSIEFLSDSVIKQSTTLSIIGKNSKICSLIFEEYYLSNPNPSNLIVTINGIEANYVSEENFDKINDLNIPIYTIFDTCNNNFPFPEDYKEEVAGYCQKGESSDKSLLIASDMTSNRCVYTVLMNNIDAKSMLKGNMLKKEFSTPFLYIRNSKPLVVDITFPKDTKIINNNLEEHINYKKDNNIEWVVKNGTDNFSEIFKVTYKKSLPQWIIDHIVNNPWTQVILFILAIFGIREVIRIFRNRS